MATSTLSVAEATQTAVPAAAPNRNLRTAPQHMAVIKVWDAMMRGARKYCEEQGFVTVHSMPHIVGVAGACENTDTLFTVDWYDGKKKLLPQGSQLYIEMLTQAIDGGRVCSEIQSFRKELEADGRLAQFFNVHNSNDPRMVNSSDLLPLAGESVGSAEREFDDAKLRAKLEDFEWYLSFHEEYGVQLYSGAGVDMACVAQFIPDQTDIHKRVPFLINRSKVI